MLHRGYRQRVRTVPHPPTRYPDNPSDMSGLGLGLFSVADAARDARIDLAQPESNTVSTRKMIRATPRVGSGPKPVAPAAVRPLSGMVASFRDTSLAFVADVEKLRLRLARPSPHGHFLNFHSVGDAQKGYLDPDHNVNECGGRRPRRASSSSSRRVASTSATRTSASGASTTTAARTHPTTTAGKSRALPIKASYCDAWYTACSGADNKLCIGADSEPGSPVYGTSAAHVTQSRAPRVPPHRRGVHQRQAHLRDDVWGLVQVRERHLCRCLRHELRRGRNQPQQRRVPVQGLPDRVRPSGRRRREPTKPSKTAARPTGRRTTILYTTQHTGIPSMQRR